MAQPEGDQGARIPRVRYGLMVFSLVVVYIMMGFTWKIGMQANDIDHELYHVTENIEGIQSNIARMEAHRQ
jgi:hypothetical protein